VFLVMFNPTLNDLRGAEQQIGQRFALTHRTFGALAVNGRQTDPGEQFDTTEDFGGNGFHGEFLYDAMQYKHCDI
jgi:hypothetical protein